MAKAILCNACFLVSRHVIYRITFVQKVQTFAFSTRCMSSASICDAPIPSGAASLFYGWHLPENVIFIHTRRQIGIVVSHRANRNDFIGLSIAITVRKAIASNFQSALTIVCVIVTWNFSKAIFVQGTEFYKSPFLQPLWPKQEACLIRTSLFSFRIKPKWNTFCCVALFWCYTPIHDVMIKKGTVIFGIEDGFV